MVAGFLPHPNPPLRGCLKSIRWNR